MNRQRRLFLKRLSQLLLYRSLPVSQLLALAACASPDDPSAVEIDPTYATVEFYTPIPGTPTPVPATARFAAIADFGDSGPDEEAVANLIKSWTPDFVVTAGDNNYFEGEAHKIDENIGQYYHQFIHPYKGTYGPGADVNRFFPALGGHDWMQPNAQPHLDYFTLPGNERYYDVRWGPAHIFILDSIEKEPDGTTAQSRQGQWLQRAMSQSDAPWKVVVTHDPPYSSGRKHGSQERMQWPFKEWGASAILAGNDHLYERLIVDDLPYFVNGLGGGRIYEFDQDDIVSGSQVRYRREHGAMLVEATDSNISFKFISRRGEVIDEHRIESGNPSASNSLPAITVKS